MTLKFVGWPRKIIGHLFYTKSSFVHHFKFIGESKLKLQSGNAQFGSKLAIFCPLWPWNLMDDLGNRTGTSSILHQALCVISKPWVNSNWSYSLKHSIRVKIGIFLSRVSLKFYGWTWKKIGHLFYISSSFLHHFKAIGEFKLEIQSGNAQFGTKSAIFCPLWPWNLMDDLEKRRAPLLCCFTLCATFHSHRSIQNRVTVRKRPIWVKIAVFCPVWPSNLTNDLENNRTPFLCFFKLCASFRSHWWIQTGVTVRKTPNLGKNGGFF